MRRPTSPLAAHMGVTFKFFSNAYSNKGGFVEYDACEVAYSTAVADHQRVIVLRPKIDKLTLVFDVDQELREALVQFISQAPKLDEEGQVSYASAAQLPGARYKWNVEFKSKTLGEKVLVQAVPKVKNAKHTFRIEMNPAKLGRNGLKIFREQFHEFMFTAISFPQVIEVAKVTRLDLAVDVIGVQIGELLLELRKPGKWHAYHAEDGLMETIYLGIKSKSNSTRWAYDKLKQLEETGATPLHGTADHTRIEARCKTMRTVMELQKLNNPLSKLRVLFPSVGKPPEEPHHWRLFVDSCRHRGIANALALIPKPVREAYAVTLEGTMKHIWRSDKLWETWPDVIASSGLLDLD